MKLLMTHTYPNPDNLETTKTDVFTKFGEEADLIDTALNVVEVTLKKYNPAALTQMEQQLHVDDHASAHYQIEGLKCYFNVQLRAS